MKMIISKNLQLWQYGEMAKWLNGNTVVDEEEGIGEHTRTTHFSFPFLYGMECLILVFAFLRFSLNVSLCLWMYLYMCECMCMIVWLCLITRECNSIIILCPTVNMIYGKDAFMFAMLTVLVSIKRLLLFLYFFCCCCFLRFLILNPLRHTHRNTDFYTYEVSKINARIYSW